MNLNLGPGYVPEFIRNGFCMRLPTAGEGVHKFLFRLARVLHPWRSEERIRDVLHQFARGCGRYVSEREITAAIEDSRADAETPKGQRGCYSRRGGDTVKAPSPWSPVNQKLLRDICLEGPVVGDLKGASPLQFPYSDGPHTEGIVDVVFPGDPWICAAGQKQCDFATKRRAEWRGSLSDQSFIVPSPMKSQNGLTRGGRVSEHAQAAVGPRRFLVVECDFAERNRSGTAEHALAPLIRELRAAKGITTLDMCSSVLWHLAQLAPLTLVVHSGGKSLHGWFCAQDHPEEKLRRFMDYACSLGADPVTWQREQFVRMPDGLRGGYIRQSPIYFNPQTIST